MIDFNPYTTCIHCHQARVRCDRKEASRPICSHCTQIGNHQCVSRESMVLKHKKQQRQQELRQLQVELLELLAQQFNEQLSYLGQQNTMVEFQWHEFFRQFLELQREEVQLLLQFETPAAEREAREQQEQQPLGLMLFQQLQFF